MLTTTAKGNTFRDLVARVLIAGGFHAEVEVKLKYKNVDVTGVWSRDEMAGVQRYAFEAKDYSGTLPLAECTQFASDFIPLLNSGQIDQAWLISKGPISPAGREAAQSSRGLQAMTFAELQRRLLLLDGFLQDQVRAYEASRLSEYYIRPETTENTDLEKYVRNWINEPGAPPLFVLGPYGKGKSTFATHLTASLAQESLSDPTVRAPILVRLGEIADEQSLEGLLGKVLANQHRVHGYHFDTLSALNSVGRFVLIYDGFDEMKHGLTPSKFQLVLSELMRLDDGEAKILVLGRDTAFHSDVEFRAVIDGIQTTPAGREVPTPGRRAYRHVQIRGFDVEEAREFVARYLPVRAAIEKSGKATDPNWVTQRVAELVSGTFDRLLERPVHAQMLCEIAIQPEQLRPSMSVYELFDSFVHYLLLRETGKRGRDSDFPLDTRRRFNAALAWWLWERGGASTTTLADIPQSLCDEAAKGVSHSLNRDEMRRELIQGCLVEKGVSTIYFHRSLQEFLAAEHLIETDLLQRTPQSSGWLQTVTDAVTPEVIEFILAGTKVSAERLDRSKKWLTDLETGRASRVSFSGFNLFVELARSLGVSISNIDASPWTLWLTLFLRSGGNSFGDRSRSTFPALANLLVASLRQSPETQAAGLYALARTLSHPLPDSHAEVGLVLAAQLPVIRLQEAIAEVRGRRSDREVIRQDEDFVLWSLLRSWRVEKDSNGTTVVKVDLQELHHDAMMIQMNGFEREESAHRTSVTVPVQAIYQGLISLFPRIGQDVIDTIRPFFNDAELRRRIIPVHVEHRKQEAAVPRPTGPKQTLTLRKHR